MIITYAQLVCEQPGCSGAYPADPTVAVSASTIRRLAPDAGWWRVGNRDYCPTCTGDLVAAVRRLAGSGRSDRQIADALALATSAVQHVRRTYDIPAALGRGERPRVGVR